MRSSGILMPIFSLPSKYGIGTFSKDAYDFVDFLKEAGQKYWQILPLGPTGYGDSPYQSFSTFAGNPYFIDIDTLFNENLLLKEECEYYNFGNSGQFIDYAKIYEGRYELLKRAFERFDTNGNTEFKDFYENNKWWLESYCLFMSIKESYGNNSLSEWDEDIKLRKSEAINHFKEIYYNQMMFHAFLQFEFSVQWKRLKLYANNAGIKIIGDIPIYVAYDSADLWSNPELFQLHPSLESKAVAGCPPDAFSKTGQLWGNPLYRWNYHKDTKYIWWIKRLEYSFELYDILRIDHFRGFDEYYSIPSKDKTAEFGHWEKGPGIELFKAMENELGQREIIAEDLGYLTDSVVQMVKDCGYKGMKVLQFAFDSREESNYLPHFYHHNCVVYTGTHDNDTISGWYKDLCIQDKNMAMDYMNNMDTSIELIHWDFIHMAYASVADTVIIPIQDYLGKGSEARINTPSTLGNNWKWRLNKNELTKDLSNKIKRLVQIYGR